MAVDDPDPPAEEELDLALVAHGEEAGVLEEERPLLGKEKIEAVEVDLLIVDLHLREVGVDRAVERQARRHVVLDVEARIAEEVGVGRGDAGFDRVAEDVGRRREVADRGHLQAGHGPGEREAIQGVLARDGRPERALVAAADVPLEVHAPDLIGAAREAQRPERDRELRRPAGAVDGRAHFPRRVPVQVEAGARARHLRLARPEAAAALALIRDLTVVLDAGRVRAEDEPVEAVAVRVEDHPEAVGVVERRVAPRVRHDDRVGLAVVAHHPDVERVGGVDDPHLRPLRRRLPLVRLLLPEIGDGRGRLPRGVADHLAVEHGGLRHRCRDDGRPPFDFAQGRHRGGFLDLWRGRTLGPCLTDRRHGRDPEDSQVSQESQSSRTHRRR